MLHPLFSTLIQRPDLLVEHVSAYSALLHEEASQAGTALVARYLAWVVAALCCAAFVLFAGISLMLGLLQNQFHWVLIAVPGSALLMMVIAVARAKAPPAQAQFKGLKAQIDSDIQALKAVS